MSVQASIEIGLSKYPQDYKSPIELLKILLHGGWTLNDHGGISYLPIGDNDDFDWVIQAQISQNELMQILEEKEQKNERIGIVLTWQETNIGGSFMFESSNEISISLTINRKIVCGENSFKMTDGNWYLLRLLPLFHENNIKVCSFTFEELA